MIEILIDGLIHVQVLNTLKGGKERYLRREMLKIVKELYLIDDREAFILTRFINDYFDQYKKENHYEVIDDQYVNFCSDLCEGCSLLPLDCTCKMFVKKIDN